jgi:hypothetical protein
MSVDAGALSGQWIHSHEEDTPSTLVFRPPGWSFPPSRGRTSFELRRDGTWSGSEPGPVDAPMESAGRWQLDGDRLVLDDDAGARTRAFQLESAERDRLVVTRR